MVNKLGDGLQAQALSTLQGQCPSI